MTHPFRILIVDDVIAPSVENATKAGRNVEWSEFSCGFVEQILKASADYASPCEIYLSKNALVARTFALPAKTEQHYKEDDALPDFFSGIDVLVLDMGGISNPRNVERVPAAIQDNFARIGQDVPSDDLERLGDTDQGVRFFHRHFSDFSTNCLIAILTGHDGSDRPIVKKFIHPFTLGGPDLPHVVKFGKSGDTDADLADLVLSHYDFFRSGLSDATNRFHISFAARHDHPVMIVGESGTGKEGIARFIHEQWKRRKQRELGKQPYASQIGRFQVVNCGGLSEQLAQAELFGFISGSFTGANEHRLGKVLISAGLDPIGKSPIKDKPGLAYKAAEKDMRELREGFAELEKADQTQHFRIFLSKIEPHLKSLFIAGGAEKTPTFMRLVAALQDAEKKLAAAVEGNSANNDFYTRLTKAGALLQEPPAKDRESDWDLSYSLNFPIGTLFLDEFADLPLSVQTLLLRFLQSGEVQPLGFAGRILLRIPKHVHSAC